MALAIAGLAGQAVSGITTLKTFFSAYKLAHTKVTTLNFELDSLLSTLLAVEQLLQRARQDSWSTLRLSHNGSVKGHKSPLEILEGQVMSCINELKVWNKASEGLHIGVWGRDVRTFARRIKIATSKDVFDEIAARITAQRQAIGNSLETISV